MNRIIDLKHHRIISASCLRKLLLSLARKLKNFFCWIVCNKWSRWSLILASFLLCLVSDYTRWFTVAKFSCYYCGLRTPYWQPKETVSPIVLIPQEFLSVKLTNIHSLTSWIYFVLVRKRLLLKYLWTLAAFSFI